MRPASPKPARSGNGSNPVDSGGTDSQCRHAASRLRLTMAGLDSMGRGGNVSEDELESPEQTDEPGILPKCLEVRILSQPFRQPIAKLKRSLKRSERRLDHSQDPIGACKIVPGNRIFGDQADKSPVQLQDASVFALGRQVIAEHSNGLNEVGIAFKDLAKELDLEVPLRLFP